MTKKKKKGSRKRKAKIRKNNERRETALANHTSIFFQLIKRSETETEAKESSSVISFFLAFANPPFISASLSFICCSFSFSFYSRLERELPAISFVFLFLAGRNENGNNMKRSALSLPSCEASLFIPSFSHKRRLTDGFLSPLLPAALANPSFNLEVQRKERNKTKEKK